MSKLKNPMLSLGARGSVGDAVTYQKRPGLHIVRKKPIPFDPYSLPQAYQRWLYQDYLTLWGSLTNAQKQVYRSLAATKHRTGVSEYLSKQLSTQPDIIGIWHLDEATGAVAHDSSLNLNHGTIFGASPVDGLISLGRYFDSIDDVISVPHHPTLNFGTSDFTLEGFMNIPDVANDRFLISKNAWAASSWLFMIGQQRHAYLYIRPPVGPGETTDSVNNAVPLNVNFHVAATVDRDGVARLFVDGQEVTYNRQPNLAAMVDIDSEADLFFGHPTINARTKGLKDEIRTYNRILTPADILRHSNRRYP